MDSGNAAIQAASWCEQVLSLLNHLRENNKDRTALIGVEKALRKRRKALLFLKRKNFRDYAKLIEMYGLDDQKAVVGDQMHRNHYHCRGSKRDL